MSKLLSKQQVAEYFAVSKQTVARWVRSGELRSIRVKGCIRVMESDLQQFVEANRTQVNP